MKKGMIIMLVACAVIFGGIFGWKWFVGMKINQYFNNMPVPAATISTAEAKRATWSETLSAVGTVEAINGIAVTSRTSGVVESIRFQSGDQVDKGDLLITLEQKEDKASLAALQAAATLAEQNLQRYQRLYKKGSVSKAQLDEMQSKRDQAAAQAKAQKARLEYKDINAPFSGQLGIRQVDLGQYIAPGTSIVMLQSLSPIYVSFALPEQELPKIAEGLPVTVKVESQPGKTFKGEIDAVNPGVDPATRNFSVQAKFANASKLLRPGMFASVNIGLPGSHEVVVVPRTAVKYNPYGDLVFVVIEEEGKDGKTTKKVVSRFVKLGEARGDMIVVTQGLKPGEVVASSGLLKLRNNLPVKIDNSVQPPAELHPHLKNS